MKNFKKIIEKRAVLKAEMESILTALETEERAITPEESARFDELEAEIRAIDSTIEAEKRAENITEPVPAGRQTEDRAASDEAVFRDFIAGRITEMRAGEQNVTMVNNAAVIPVSIANRILDEVVELCPILNGADVYHEKGTLKIPKWTKANSTHDVSVGYSAEFTELKPDSGKFISVDLGGYLAGALVLVGKSVINNAAVNVTSFIIKKIAEKVSQFLEKELLAGTGSSAAQGALNTANTVTAGAADNIAFDDLVTLQSAVKQVYQKNACWTMHSTTFTAIKLMKDANGRPLIEPDASKAFPYMLLGKPVHLSDNMPVIGKGAKTVLYGDYSGLSVNFRENIGIEVLREAYHTQHAVGIDAWFEFDSRITDEQKLAVLVQAQGD